MRVIIGSNTYTCNSPSQKITDGGNFNGVFTCPADISTFCQSVMTCA